jgi:hypothetical protein
VIALAVVFGTNIRPLPDTPAYWLWATFKPHEEGFDPEADKKKGAMNQGVILAISLITLIVMVGGLFYWALG